MLAEYFPLGDVLATGLVMEYSPLYPLTQIFAIK